MANLPLESVIINPLERPTSKDINQLQMQAHQDMRMLARELFYGQFGTYSDGFVGDGFKPTVLNAVDRTLNMLNGVMFQFRLDAENNIGGIQGLSDVYPYKAAFNYAGIAITIDDAPATSGFSRIDLIQVRVPIGAERLKDLTATGIFDPTLKTVSSEDKPKLLSSTLTATDVQTIPAGAALGTATQPIIYKLGTEGASPVAPAEEAGYLTIATVTSTYGQADLLEGDISDDRNLLYLNPTVGGTGVASLPAGEILLGNGTSGITSTAILPMSKGGTGRAPITFLDTLGSVAYLDTSGDDSLKYSQAAGDGYLLASNTAGAPTWVAPGASGTVLTSNGTSWAAAVSYSTDSIDQTTTYTTTNTAYTAVTNLELADFAVRTGNVRIRLQPIMNADSNRLIFFKNNSTLSSTHCDIKFEVVGPLGTDNYVFSYEAETEKSFSITPPALELFLSAGDYTITVYGRVSSAQGYLEMKNCSLVVSQG